jgi:hypothetical protein
MLPRAWLPARYAWHLRRYVGSRSAQQQQQQQLAAPLGAAEPGGGWPHVSVMLDEVLQALSPVSLKVPSPPARRRSPGSSPSSSAAQ